MFAYTFNLFIIYNSASAFDVVFNALAIEFIIQFDEESVGPLLALQEGLFGIDTADFTEGVVAAVNRIERESAGYTSMNVFIAKLCRMGPAKAALVYCLRNYFTRFALLVLLVFFEIVLLVSWTTQNGAAPGRAADDPPPPPPHPPTPRCSGYLFVTESRRGGPGAELVRRQWGTPALKGRARASNFLQRNGSPRRPPASLPSPPPLQPSTRGAPAGASFLSRRW